MSKAITMESVAAFAGVTAATVSMCLANHPKIPRSTRDRVQTIARQLGYRPNPYLAALMTVRRRRTSTQLILVCTQRTSDGWRNHPSPTIRQMREGAIHRAIERGYRTQEIWLHRDGMSNRRFSEILYARGVQGVLIGPVADGDAPPTLGWEHFAAVSLSVPQLALNLTTVCNDHYASALQATLECGRRNYRRPGLLLRAGHQERFQGRWQAGFLIGAQMNRELSPVAPMFAQHWHDPAILQWIERERPDVVISAGGQPVLDLIQSAGRKIPQDLGLVYLACPELGGPITGIWQNGVMIGALAMDTLINRLRQHERGLSVQPTSIMAEGRWNEGTTLRRPRREP